MKEETDTDPLVDTVWPPPIHRDQLPIRNKASARRGTAIGILWAFGLILNMAGSGHKDFPESLRQNLWYLAADAGCWLAVGLLGWNEMQEQWRRGQWVLVLLLALCAGFGVFIWGYRAAYSDFW